MTMAAKIRRKTGIEGEELEDQVEELGDELRKTKLLLDAERGILSCAVAEVALNLDFNVVCEESFKTEGNREVFEQAFTMDMAECLKVAQAGIGVEFADLLALHRVELAPMRSGVEGRESALDLLG